MDWEDRCLQAGAAALVLALLLRISTGSTAEKLVRILRDQRVVSAVFFLETGRVMRPVPAEEEPALEPAEYTEEYTENTIPEPVEEPAVFGPENQQDVAVNCFCGYDPQIEAMLKSPLQWNLYGQAPTVLILHTHTTESYENTEGYPEKIPYRCMDEHYNVVSVGEHLAELLRQQGISVLHDKTVHDEPSYSHAYDASRETARQYLEQYPSIRLVLDLHRDAAENSSGQQVALSTEVDGKKIAQMMIVVGTDAGGLEHPDWRQNLALAVKLHASMEKIAPGICRPIGFRSQRFNQDLCPGSLLVEIGAAGNTRQQALESVEILARGIENLAGGSVWQEMQ